MRKMKAENTIIRNQVVQLQDQFESIKNTIENKEEFANLLKICSFNNENKSLIFKTEKIHPKYKNGNIIPVMMLFSNPHPLSVQTGIFLSESRSRSFWRRLFECKSMNPPQNLMEAITNWTDSSPHTLSDYLLKGGYSDKFILFFDCLEELPTNQYADLKKIFHGKIGRNLRKQELQIPGYQNIINISKKHQIKSWIIFSSEAYRYVARDRKIARHAPKRICHAIDDYISNGDKKKFWISLNDLKSTINYDNYEITVYLSLIARRKNWQAQNGEKYFTIMLNQIFDHISVNY